MMLALGTGSLSQCFRYTPHLYGRRAVATKIPGCFTHYIGPGGLKRLDPNNKIEVFNRKAAVWIETQYPDLHAIVLDSIPVSEEEASVYIQKFKERKIGSPE